MHSEMLLMAASFTSNSLSVISTLKYCIRFPFVMSLPNELAKWEKFFANARRTFHDLSSLVASKVPRVCI